MLQGPHSWTWTRKISDIVFGGGGSVFVGFSVRSSSWLILFRSVESVLSRFALLLPLHLLGTQNVRALTRLFERKVALRLGDFCCVIYRMHIVLCPLG